MSKGKVLRGEAVAEYGMPSLRLERKVPSGYDPAESAEALEREAYEKGFQAGERAGYEVGEKKARMLLEGLEAIIAELTEVKKRVLSELEPRVFALSVGMAKRILREEIRQNREGIVNLIKAAMQKIERMDTIVIKVNPVLKELIERHRPELMSIHPEVKFDLDPSVPPSGPLVVSPEQEVITDPDLLMSNLLEDLGEGVRDDGH